MSFQAASGSPSQQGELQWDSGGLVHRGLGGVTQEGLGGVTWGGLGESLGGAWGESGEFGVSHSGGLGESLRWAWGESGEFGMSHSGWFGVSHLEAGLSHPGLGGSHSGGQLSSLVLGGPRPLASTPQGETLGTWWPRREALGMEGSGLHSLPGGVGASVSLRAGVKMGADSAGLAWSRATHPVWSPGGHGDWGIFLRGWAL